MSLSYLVWRQGSTVVRGRNDSAWVDGSFAFPVSFPGVDQDPQLVTLSSSASIEGSLETFTNVRFFLTGDPGDLAIVQGVWPSLGDSYSPARPEMNGGLEISFDGQNFTRFSSSVGLESDPSTWITMPALAVGLGGADGTLGAYDLAQIYLRLVVPSVADSFRTFSLQLAADVDIV